MLKTFFVVILFSLINADEEADEWNYGHLGPAMWSETYPTCGGHLQSPINILTACTTFKNFARFQFGKGYNDEHNFTLTNNGHTVAGSYVSESKLPAFELSGGELSGTFQFVNFHVHWGENHKTGSEHEVNGRQYAGELHFVYRNPMSSKTAVLGIFMESVILNKTNNNTNYTHFFDPETRHEWLRFFQNAEYLKHKNDSLVMKLNLTALMGDNLDEFWRYEGSLTTPPCTEGVIWTIFKQPILFDEDEFVKFREDLFFKDFRETQPLFYRQIDRNFLVESVSNVPDYNCCPKMNKTRSIFSNSSSFVFCLNIFLLFFVLQFELVRMM